MKISLCTSERVWAVGDLHIDNDPVILQLPIRSSNGVDGWMAFEVNGSVKEDCACRVSFVLDSMIETSSKVPIDAYSSSTGNIVTECFPVHIKPPSGRSFVLEVNNDTTVADVKTMIENKGGMTSVKQILVFGGYELADDASLATYSIQKDCTIFVVALFLSLFF